MNGDNIVTLRARQARELTQLEAITMAMDSAADRGRAGDPQAFLDGLPGAWSVVDTAAVGHMAGELMDALVAIGLDGDEERQRSDDDDQPMECVECGYGYGTHTPGCPLLPRLVVVQGDGTAAPA